MAPTGYPLNSRMSRKIAGASGGAVAGKIDLAQSPYLAALAGPQAEAAKELETASIDVAGALPRHSYTLDQIRTFLSVAAREHVTQAATALGLSQAAVTQQVHLLERSLGVPLLQRFGRNIRLTETGLDVAAACLVIVKALENLDRIARTTRTLEAGSLAIGASETAGSYYLSQRLGVFTAEHPGIQVVIRGGTTRDICGQIAAGDLECGLVDGPLPKTTLTQVRVAVDEVIIVARPESSIVGTRHINKADLVKANYLARDPDDATEIVASQMLGSAYIRAPRVQFTGFDAVRQALLLGLGYAAMPSVVVADDLSRGRLTRIGIAPRARPIWAVRRSGTASIGGEVFWRILSAA